MAQNSGMGVSSVAVLVTGFNRPEKLRLVFTHLSSLPNLRLYFACDGPRTGVDKATVNECHAIARHFVSDESRLLLREKNLGCYQAMYEAITWFFSKETEGVINEDDVIIDQSFFECVRILLPALRSNLHIYQINSFLALDEISCSESFFVGKFCSSWGWATWQNRWSQFRHEVRVNRSTLNIIRDAIGNGRLAVFFVLAFVMMRQNKMSSWHYRWTYSVWRSGALTLTPRIRLSENFGADRDATHTANQFHILGARRAMQNAPGIALSRFAPRAIKRDREIYFALYGHFTKWKIITMFLSICSPAWFFRFVRKHFR